MGEQFDLKAYHDQAERNFHLGVETYEIFTQPSNESAKVLMLAVSALTARQGPY